MERTLLILLLSTLLCGRLVHGITTTVSDTSRSVDVHELNTHSLEADILPRITDDNPTESSFTRQYEYYKGFELAYPKPIDQLPASYCTVDYCVYPGIIAGWFWGKDWKQDDMPFEIKLKSRLLDFEHDLTNCKVMISTEGYLGLQFNFQMQLPFKFLVMDLSITMTNAKKEIVFETTSHFTLLHRNDIFLPKYLHQFQVFAQAHQLIARNFTHFYTPTTRNNLGIEVSNSGSSANINTISTRSTPTKAPRLDFLEIGTSDFSTALQQASAVQALFQQKIYGISMEPILQYQSNLPDVDGVFKLNAAIDLNNSVGDIQQMYYLPSTLSYLIQNAFIRGCSQIGGIHPYALRVATRAKVPAFVFQKAVVKTFIMQELWQDFILPYFSGLGLLKVDIEGMDQQVVLETIDYLAALSGQQTVASHWPCVIYFETNEWSGFRDEKLMGRLQAVGYHLLHELGAESSSLLARYRTSRRNETLVVGVEKTETFAFQCTCDSSDYHKAVELIKPTEVDADFVHFVCSHSR